MKLEFWGQKKFHKLKILKKRDLIWGEAIPHMRVSLIWGVPETPSIAKVLWLCDMSLSEENTRALVTAMRARVKTVRLWENVTLDLELLAAYDGQGHCTKLVMYRDTRRRYRTRLSRWAVDRGWTVTCEDSEELEMERISQTSSPGSENQGSCTVI